jgi:hypothetical protein
MPVGGSVMKFGGKLPVNVVTPQYGARRQLYSTVGDLLI